MEPMSSFMRKTSDWRSMTQTFAPSSAAAQMAGMPPVPAPTTTTSASTVSEMLFSSICGASPSHSGFSAG